MFWRLGKSLNANWLVLDEMNIPRDARWQLWICAAAFFMETLDATIVNTALPAMALSLGVHPLQMHVVVLAYVLTVAVMLPASGWIADRLGIRHTLLLAITLFSAGSLAAAMSTHLPMLIAARVLQGLGGAMMVPVGRLAVLKAVPRSQFMAAMSLVTMPGLVGPLLGPPLGGILVEYATWHWIFLINLPVAFLGILAVRRWMPNYQMPPRSFDRVGFVLLAPAMALLTLALEGAGHSGGRQTTAVFLLLAALLLATSYGWHARRSSSPLFSLKLFACRTFAFGIAGNLLARVGSGALPFLTPLFLQVGLGFSPLHAGLSMVPIVLGSMGMKTLVVRIVTRFGYRRVLVVSTLLLATNTWAFAWAGVHGWHGLLVPQLLLLGMINSIRFTAMNVLTLKDLGDDQASSGNSLLSMVMQLAMSLGVSLVGMLLSGFDALVPHTPEVAAAFMHTYLWLSLVMLAPVLLFVCLPGGRGRCEQ